MRIIKFLIFLLLTVPCSLFPVYCSAQDLGIPSITGKPGATIILRNYEAIGVNPANLGWDDNDRFSIGLAYIGLNLQSNVLDFHELINSFITGNSNNDVSTNEILKLFNNNNSLNINANVTLIGLSLHIPGFGGIGFSVNDMVTAHISAQVISIPELDTLLKAGSNVPNISSFFKSANLNIQYLREYNLAYGREIREIIPDLDLYGGIGYRYILGLANINANAENGILTAQTSLNNNNYQDFINNLKRLNDFNSDGHGNAIDLGVNAVYLDKFKFGLALDNIGYIKWRSITNLMLSVDSLQNLKKFNELFSQKNVTGVSSSTTWLPATLRMGAGIKVVRFFEVGADIAVPLNTVNGYKDNTLMSLGGELNIFHFLKINSGFSGNPNIGWNVPFGITISAYGLYDIYIATNDILTFVGSTRNPMATFAFCAIRFNIPPPKKK